MSSDFRFPRLTRNFDQCCPSIDCDTADNNFARRYRDDDALGLGAVVDDVAYRVALARSLRFDCKKIFVSAFERFPSPSRVLLHPARIRRHRDLRGRRVVECRRRRFRACDFAI